MATKYEVFKVRHVMGRGGKYGHYLSDLIFVDAAPKIVIEWEEMLDGDIPSVTVDLDPKRLRRLDWPEADYLYEIAIEDPRRLS